MAGLLSMAILSPLCGGHGAALATTKIEKTFGAWRVFCVEDKGDKRCTMTQARALAQSKQLAVAWSVARSPKGKAVNTLILPTGVSIPEGVRVGVGGKTPSTIGYSVCGARACQASVILDDSVLTSEGILNISYVRANKQLVQAQIELKGYAEAYGYLVEQSK